jgi:hypothetical protein
MNVASHFLDHNNHNVEEKEEGRGEVSLSKNNQSMEGKSERLERMT